MQNKNEHIQRFTVFRNHSNIVTNATLKELIEAISLGRFKHEVERLRNHLSNGNKNEAQQEKRKLDAFTASGVFKGRRLQDTLESYSGLIILDFDKLDETLLVEYLEKIRSIEYTNFAFISPSGKGIKVLVKIDSDKVHHKVAFDQVANYYQKELHIEVDRSGSDITRLCYLSYDPELYFNEDSLIFHVDIETNISNSDVNQSCENIDSNKDYLDAVSHTKNIAKFEEGNRNNFIYTLAKNCNRSGISADDATTFIMKDFGYDKKAVEASIKSAYNQTVNEDEVRKTPLFSIDYLHSRRYKSDEKMDTRALFEVFLMKYLHFRKPFFYSRAAIQHDLGIKKDRAKTIINYLKKIGFLDYEVRTTQIEGSPRQVTYFKVLPENIPNVIDQLMVDGEEIKNRLKPLLDSDEGIGIGYGYQE